MFDKKMVQFAFIMLSAAVAAVQVIKDAEESE